MFYFDVAMMHKSIATNYNLVTHCLLISGEIQIRSMLRNSAENDMNIFGILITFA